MLKFNFFLGCKRFVIFAVIVIQKYYNLTSEEPEGNITQNIGPDGPSSYTLLIFC
jgi:hypothetical protein